MKKLAFLMATLMMLAMVLTACGGETPVSSGAASGSGSESASSAPAANFDPSLFQVVALDDQTLEVTLAAPTPYFLELTAFPTYFPVPMHVINEVGESWATDAASYIGNGPYKTVEWTSGSHITMEKNESYWNYDALGPDSIKFSLIEDDTAQFNAFQSGELQFIDNMPQDEIPNLLNTPEFHVTNQLGTYYVSFNVEVAPFDDPLVRQAFTLAIDRDFMANVVGNGLYTPAGAFVAPQLYDATPPTQFRDVGGDYYDPSASAYESNLEEAKRLLEEAGYPNGEGLPVIEYIYNDNTLHKGVAEALQNQWGQLGATVEIEVQEWATFLNSRKNGEFMIARDGWLSDYNDPITMLDLYVTDSGNNNAQWSNPDFDKLIEDIKSTGDAAERFEMMHQAEDMIFDEWIIAPIMYYGDPWMLDASLSESVYDLPLGYKFFMYAEGFDDLNVCVGPTPDTIDPALNSAVDGATLIIHGFEGLYALDRNGVPAPAQAESYEVSEDGLVYTFHLREGLQWSDGTPITAQDFVDSWVRAIDPATGADYSYMFACIAGYAEATGSSGEH